MELKPFPWKILPVVMLFVKLCLHQLISLKSGKLKDAKPVYGQQIARNHLFLYWAPTQKSHTCRPQQGVSLRARSRR